MVHLVRDLLDKAVIDRNGREMGRVDRVVIERGHGSPSRVVAIEVGPSALAARLGGTFGGWITGLLYGLGIEQGQPLRVHVGQILSVTDTVKVDLAFGETAAANLERKLRRLVKRIPGASQ
jgi:sporulation protein YlmC with PRC-barrel domain